MLNQTSLRPELRFDSTYTAVGSAAYEAAVGRIRLYAAALSRTDAEALCGEALEAEIDRCGKAFDELDSLLAFVRLSETVDDVSSRPEEAGEVLHGLLQQLLRASGPLARRTARAAAANPGSRMLTAADHAFGRIHHAWLQSVGEELRDFIQSMRVTCFWPLTASYEHLLRLLTPEVRTEEGLTRRLSFAQCLIQFRSTPEREMRRRIFEGLNRQAAVLAPSFADLLNSIEGVRLLMYRHTGADFRRTPFAHADVSFAAWEAMRRVLRRHLPEIRRTVSERAQAFGPRKMQPYDLLAGAPFAKKRLMTPAQALAFCAEAGSAVSPDFEAFVFRLAEERSIEMRASFTRTGEAYSVPLGVFGRVCMVSPFANDIESALVLSRVLGEAWVQKTLLALPRFEREVSPLVTAAAGALHETLARRCWLRKAGPQSRAEVVWHHQRALATALLNWSVRTDFEMRFLEERASGIVGVRRIKTLLASAWQDWYGDTTEAPDGSLWITQKHFYDTHRFMAPAVDAMGCLLSHLLVDRLTAEPERFPAAYEAFLLASGRSGADALFREQFGLTLADEAVWEHALESALRPFEPASGS